MPRNVLLFLDYYFLIFHTLFTLFNIFGWIWKKTRRFHLYTIAATLFSWVILGFWYGFGFCFCTQWHWQVMARLGRFPDERGYIQFLVNRVTGREWPYEQIEVWTLIVMIFISTASIFLNFRDYYLKRRKRQKTEE